MKRGLVAIVSTVACVVVGCDNHKKWSQPSIPANNIPVQNAFDVGNQKAISDTDAEKILAGTLNLGEFNSIKLNKNALGQTFLLTPTVILASNIPIIDHTEPKIVRFELSGNKIALFEVNFSTVYNDFNSDKLLQVFEITNQTESTLEFKWDFGLDTISRDPAYVTSDFPGTANNKVLNAESSVLPVEKSFVKSLEFSNNSLFVEQVSRVRTQALPFDINTLLVGILGGNPIPIKTQDLTIHLTMEITPYTPNPAFVPQKSVLNKGIGYFETLAMEKGKADPGFHAMRWDLGPGKKPITYAITNSVPAHMESAIREGILYWNKTLGFEGLRVETGANPRSRPQDKRVLVHWIKWDDAGFARASMQADPITGEIKRGDVYMTSVFPEAAKISARKISAQKNLGGIPFQSAAAIVPAGFASRTTCHLNYSDFASLDTKHLTEQQLQRAEQDMVREVVAHEVGHTLGLRHNFAGSQESEIESHTNSKQVESDYFSSESHPGAATASSVMDYLPTFDSILLGAKIKNEALPYDKTAIDWGYNAGSLPPKEKSNLFCTDSLAARISGCELFDSGHYALDNAVGILSTQRTHLTQQLMDALLTYRFPKDAHKAMSISEILHYLGRIDLSSYAYSLTQPLQRGATILAKDSRIFSVEALFEGAGPTWYNKQEYDDATTQKLRDELSRVNGFSGLLQAAYPMRTTEQKPLQPEHGWLKTQVLNIISSPSFRSGTTLEGVAYELSDAELTQIRTFVLKLAAEFEDIYLQAVLKSVFPRNLNTQNSGGFQINLGAIGIGGGNESRTYRENLVTNDWATSTSGIVSEVVLSSKESFTGFANGTAMQLPKSLFKTSTRIASLSGLDEKTFGVRGWLKGSRSEIKNSIVSRLRLLGNANAQSSYEFEEQVKNLDLDKPTQNWAEEEIAVLKAIESLEN
jgi:hypothetical protein